MNKSDYHEWVKSRLDMSLCTSPRDLEDTASCIDDCYNRGFTKEDALAFTRLTEDFNPEMEEEIALQRMAVITSKYKHPTKVTKQCSRLH